MIVIADLHLGDAHDTVLMERPEKYPHLLDMVDSRTLQTLMRMDEALDAAAASDKVLVIAGDVFDVHRPYPWVVAEFEEFLLRARSKSVDVHVIPGNHDSDAYSYATATFIPTDLCRVYHDLTVKTVARHRVLFYPHVNLMLDRQYASKNKSHREVARKMGADIIVSHGTPLGIPDLYVDEEMSRVNLLDPSDFAGAMLVAGHHHGNRCGVINGCTVVVPGSVSITSFDHYDDRNVYVEITKDGKVKSHEFVSQTVQYLQLELKAPLTETQMKKALHLSEGALLKLRVFAKKRGDVNEAELRTVFGRVAHVKKFEVRLDEVETVEARKVSLGVSKPEKLLAQWLERQDAPKKVKTSALSKGKLILEASVRE